MSKNLRLRLPGGACLSIDTADLTLDGLRKAAAVSCGSDASAITLLSGFPPSVIACNGDTPALTWVGGTLTVVVAACVAPSISPTAVPTVVASRVPPSHDRGTGRSQPRPARAAKQAAGPRISAEIALQNAAAASEAAASARKRPRERTAIASPPPRRGIATLHASSAISPPPRVTAWRTSGAYTLGGAGTPSQRVPARARVARLPRGVTLEEHLASAVSTSASRGDPALDFLREAAQIALARQYDVARGNARLAAAQLGEYSITPVASSRTLAGVASKLAVRFRVGRHWEEETVDNVPAAALVAVLRAVVSAVPASASTVAGVVSAAADSDELDSAIGSRELVKPHMLAQVMPRQFWALVRFGGALLRRRGLSRAHPVKDGDSVTAFSTLADADPFDGNAPVTEGQCVNPSDALTALLPSIDWAFLTARARKLSDKALAAVASSAAANAVRAARQRKRAGLRPAATPVVGVISSDRELVIKADELGSATAVSAISGDVAVDFVASHVYGPSASALDTAIIAALSPSNDADLAISNNACISVTRLANSPLYEATPASCALHEAVKFLQDRMCVSHVEADVMATDVRFQDSKTEVSTIAGHPCVSRAAVADAAIAGAAAAIAKYGDPEAAFLLQLGYFPGKQVHQQNSTTPDKEEIMFVCDTCNRVRRITAGTQAAEALTASESFVCGPQVPGLAARGACRAPDDRVAHLLGASDDDAAAAAVAAVGLISPLHIASADIPDDDVMLYSGGEDAIADCYIVGAQLATAARQDNEDTADTRRLLDRVHAVAAALGISLEATAQQMQKPSRAPEPLTWSDVLATRVPPAIVLRATSTVDADDHGESHADLAQLWCCIGSGTSGDAGMPEANSSADNASCISRQFLYRLRGIQLVAAAALAIIDATSTGSSSGAFAATTSAVQLPPGPRLLEAWHGELADAAVALLRTPRGWVAAASLARLWHSYARADVMSELLASIISATANDEDGHAHGSGTSTFDGLCTNDTEDILAALERIRLFTAWDLQAVPADALLHLLHAEGLTAVRSADVQAWQSAAAALLVEQPWMQNVRAL